MWKDSPRAELVSRKSAEVSISGLCSIHGLGVKGRVKAASPAWPKFGGGRGKVIRIGPRLAIHVVSSPIVCPPITSASSIASAGASPRRRRPTELLEYAAMSVSGLRMTAKVDVLDRKVRVEEARLSCDTLIRFKEV